MYNEILGNLIEFCPFVVGKDGPIMIKSLII